MDGNYLKKNARKDTIVEVINIEKGPKTIESFYDEAFALPGILKIVREIKNQYAGIIINCFADPGLKPAREVCDIPVVGPGESAIILASMLGHNFSIISVKKNVIPMFEMKAVSLGLSKRLSSVEYIDIPVSELEDDFYKTEEAIIKAINSTIKQNNTEVAVLGCTGMLSLYSKVAKRVSIPVVEPAATALKTLEILIDLRISHSKTGLYITPEVGKIIGY
jgi:allantoin racemase